MSEVWEEDSSANPERIKGKLIFDSGVKLDSVELQHCSIVPSPITCIRVHIGSVLTC